MIQHCPLCREIIDESYDEFMAFDRAYFAAHPDETTILRPPFPTEHPFSCTGAQAVLVERLAPGLRHRRDVRVCHEADPRAEMILRPDRTAARPVYVPVRPS